MQLQCCGVDSYRDFQNVLRISIPGSCCGKNSNDTCDQQNAYKTGCVIALKDLFKYASAVLGGIALGIAAIEVNKLFINPHAFIKSFNETRKLSYIYRKDIITGKEIWQEI